MTDGDHPSTLDVNTNVRLGLVLALIGAAATAGAAHWRLGFVEASLSTTQMDSKISNATDHSHALRIQALEQNHAQIMTALGKIEQFIDQSGPRVRAK